MILKPEELAEMRTYWEEHEEHALDVTILIEEVFRLRKVLERIQEVCGPDNRLIHQIASEALKRAGCRSK